MDVAENNQVQSGCKTACAVFDRAGKLLHAGPSFFAMWRLSGSDSAEKLSLEALFSEPDEALAVLAEAFNGGDGCGRLLAERGDGTSLRVQASAVRVPGEGGSEPRVAVSFMEVAEPEGLAAERDRYRNMFDALFENCPDPSYMLDHDAQICMANSAAAAMHESTPEDLVGKNIAELDDPVSASKVDDRIARCLAGERLRFEVKHKLPGGGEVPLEVFMTPFDYAGQTRMICIDRDITAHRAAKKIIRESAEHRSLALSSARHGVWDLHIPSDTTKVSDEYAEILGYDPDGFEETNAKFLERLHPDDHESTMGTFGDYLAGRIDSFRVEFRQKTQSGIWIWLQSSGKIVERDEEGNPIRIIGTITDISKMKAAHQRLSELRQQLERIERVSLASGLAATLSHELNQPLCAMSNYLASLTHALSQSPAEIDQAREDTARANEAAHRAAQIIRRFKDLYADRPLQARPCSMPELIQQSLELISDEAHQRGIRILAPRFQSVPQVMADPILTQQVIINLLRNAIEAMPSVAGAKHELKLSLQPADDEQSVDMRVRDTGPGLPPDVVDHLFEAYNSTKPERLGMGLSICWLIVRAHGGQIELEHTGHQGSVFVVRLPVFNPTGEIGSM